MLKLKIQLFMIVATWFVMTWPEDEFPRSSSANIEVWVVQQLDRLYRLCVFWYCALQWSWKIPFINSIHLKPVQIKEATEKQARWISERGTCVQSIAHEIPDKMSVVSNLNLLVDTKEKKYCQTSCQPYAFQFNIWNTLQSTSIAK